MSVYLPVIVPLIAGPVLCLMAIAVGLYVTRNQYEGR